MAHGKNNVVDSKQAFCVLMKQHCSFYCMGASTYPTISPWARASRPRKARSSPPPILPTPHSDQSMLTVGLGEVSLQRINLRIDEPCHPSALFKASCRSSSSTCHCTRPRLELAAAAAAALSECWVLGGDREADSAANRESKLTKPPVWKNALRCTTTLTTAPPYNHHHYHQW